MNSQNIRKLRHKFVAIAMISLLIVMVFLGTTINLISYYFSVSTIHSTLDGIARQNTLVRQFGQQGPFAGIFSPEYRHNHYFVFTYDAEGNLTDTAGNSDDSDEWATVQTYADKALVGRADFARKGEYYYLKTTDADQNTVVALLDCSAELSFSYRILVLTLGISLLGLGITFVLVYRFSGKAVRPEIENARRQKEFITNASHELKTPLAVIRANTEVLEMMTGGNEWTRSTLDQVERIDGLIRNLVMIAKAQEQAEECEKVTVDVSAAVAQTVDNYSVIATQTGRTLACRVQEGVTLLAAEADIRQLTTILVDNALKYCDEEGRIEVRLAAIKKGGIELAVANTYAEGATVDCDRFFDRFYRNDQSHNIDRGGYGIGLSIAESICTKYGGNIHAEWHEGTIYFVCRLY